jgi:hypothetical protein
MATQRVIAAHLDLSVVRIQQLQHEGVIEKYARLVVPDWRKFVGSENVARQSLTLTLTMNVADLFTIKLKVTGLLLFLILQVFLRSSGNEFEYDHANEKTDRRIEEKLRTPGYISRIFQVGTKNFSKNKEHKISHYNHPVRYENKR